MTTSPPTIPTPLRAITLHPWWAYAITHGDKRIEYRTRPLPAHLIGVPVALHAGAASPGEREGLVECMRIQKARSIGAPIDAWRAAGGPSSAFVAVVTFGGHERPTKLGGDWAVGWRIAEVHRLSTPWPAAGKQGFWTCTEHQREAIARSWR